ncbi:MAG: type II toxin-antitoxin system VapC family toxin [Opitutaceae bacterium]|jgi:predicted nucleic acid-binding protein
MICDSTLFVALDRERRRRKEGPAHQFLRAHPSERIEMSVVTRGELARGFTRRADWEDFCDGFTVHPLDEDVLWKAAEVFRDLRKRGEPTGENDLWIAATALVTDQPLVTANAKDFQKIRGLIARSHLSGA